ncbi:MAG: hypothetical protein HC921_19040, partial [Synechococcaceae cyanobacterium SM2_3_1]|nr:hypothetical protein [Synechococcaceae cyanobacterium SM2_3_1]
PTPIVPIGTFDAEFIQGEDESPLDFADRIEAFIRDAGIAADLPVPGDDSGSVSALTGTSLMPDIVRGNQNGILEILIIGDVSSLIVPSVNFSLLLDGGANKEAVAGPIENPLVVGNETFRDPITVLSGPGEVTISRFVIENERDVKDTEVCVNSSIATGRLTLFDVSCTIDRPSGRAVGVLHDEGGLTIENSDFTVTGSIDSSVVAFEGGSATFATINSQHELNLDVRAGAIEESNGIIFVGADVNDLTIDGFSNNRFSGENFRFILRDDNRVGFSETEKLFVLNQISGNSEVNQIPNLSVTTATGSIYVSIQDAIAQSAVGGTVTVGDGGSPQSTGTGQPFTVLPTPGTPPNNQFIVINVDGLTVQSLNGFASTFLGGAQILANGVTLGGSAPGVGQGLGFHIY